MVVLLDADDDFRIRVARHVGLGFARERQRDARRSVATGRQLDEILARDLDLRPLAPQVNPVAASTTSAMWAPPTRADVSRKYQRRPRRADELGVRHAADRPSVPTPRALSAASGCHAAASCGTVRVVKMPPSCATAERRLAVRCAASKRLALPHDRVDVVDVARRRTARSGRTTVDRRAPRSPATDRRRCSMRSRWRRPPTAASASRAAGTSPRTRAIRRRSRTWTKSGTRMPAFARPDAHRELVAEVARGRLAHAGDAQVLAQRAAVSTSKSSSATMRSSARVRARWLTPFSRSSRGDVARDVEELVDRLARPVGITSACRR